MNRKYLIIGVAVLAALAGCPTDSGPSGEDVADDANVDVSNTTIGKSYQAEVKITEENQQQLVAAQPPKLMERSLERQNLIRRYQYLNDQNNVHYVYLLGWDGTVVARFVAQGKVSSVNSKLTNNRQIVASNQCLKTTHNDNEGGCFMPVESPQMDGSYGTNGAAIFFFTTDGHYIEWNGMYLVSEQPQQVNQRVVLTQQVNETG